MFNRKIIKGQYIIFESPENTQELEKESAEEIAKKIIEDAERKASEIIENAKHEAENIVNEAHLAYAEEIEKARREGKERAENELNLLIEQYSQQLNQLLSSFEKSINLELYNVRMLLFNILKLLVNKFLDIEILSSPKWIENSLNKIIEKFINFNKIKIHISSNIINNYSQLIEKFDSLDNIEIIEDITLPDFSLSVHTDMGKIIINKDNIIKQVNTIIEEELNDERL
ncbi:hypothetical protein X275_08425 [Marinitoga sp. 1197]|uniref:hypothetical protein n=1 Tax=Marinitoga sp. 1197 TaxID=1428449 RepID=UPI0006411517|nr:hypothetical protein [Marinitoga sp. 1197]KLO21622.1 hypothetical protein X275_08425 [Marinitoga sp. 1197]